MATANSNSHQENSEFLQTISVFVGNQIALLQTFVDLLRQEQILLTSGQLQALDEITHKKEQFIAQFAGSQKSLTKISPSLSPGSPPYKLWQQFMALLSQAREINELNGKLLGMRLNHNQQALQTLQVTSNLFSLYDQAGFTQWSNGAARTLGKA